MKKKWTNKVTASFVSETDDLISRLKAFRKKWRSAGKKYQRPNDEDVAILVDKQADLSDCFDGFFDE